MIEMVLFHHHSSIYNEDWSKPGFGRCAQILVIYTTLFYTVRVNKFLKSLLVEIYFIHKKEDRYCIKVKK